MRPVVRLIKLPHLNYAPSGGKLICYYRPKGQKGVRMPDLPHDHPEFLAAYCAAAGLNKPPRITPTTGSIADGVRAWLASPAYRDLAENTRAVRRRAADDIAERYGIGRMSDLKPEYIRRDLARLAPHPANNRLKVWRSMGKWWAEIRMIALDPAAEIKARPVPATGGHVAWNEHDVAKFRARWPIESPERLAMELLHFTGARMSDAARLSERMIGADGWLTYRQRKTGGEVEIPLSALVPDFADATGQAELLHAMDARLTRHMVFMVTAFGAPRSIKAASAWFAAAARSAGIEGKTAHGLRKRRAGLMAERGATTHQIAAWTGHESLSEVEAYSKKANRRLILSGTPVEHQSSKSAATGPKGDNK